MMDTTPLAQDIWEGIGGHFDTFSQILSEFIDNSIGNFEGHKVSNRSLNITINEIDEKRISVVVEDTGTGIKKFEPVLRLGDKTIRESPYNEHGFGLKHALASANPSNDSWKIYSRTKEDLDKNQYWVVSAPYTFSLEPIKVLITDKNWPGTFNDSGTIIEFMCLRSLYDTIHSGVPGKPNFLTALDYVKEEIGYIYAGVIERGMATIILKSDSGYYERMISVKPDWAGYYDPKTGTKEIDLGEGTVKVKYKFGEMKKGAYKKFYRRNTATNGIEIRLNGRVIMSNIFYDIWQILNHPEYNHFLGIIDIISDDRKRLPKTRTSKNGIRYGDEKLLKLYEWIHSVITPERDLSDAVSERDLVKQLAKRKKKHIPAKDKKVEEDYPVFARIGSPVFVDLYVYDGKTITLYEAKKDVADVKSLYQLLMYWDGAVSDGLKPTRGILVSSKFSPGVDEVMDILNARKDENGNNYKLSKQTWEEADVPLIKVKD